MFPAAHKNPLTSGLVFFWGSEYILLQWRSSNKMAIYKKDYENFNFGKLTPDGADLVKCCESWNMWQLLG